MKKKNNKRSWDLDFDDILIETEEDCFEIGQIYDSTPAKKIRCKKCGGDKFMVGCGGYFTAIKCPNCEYEMCIHDG